MKKESQSFFEAASTGHLDDLRRILKKNPSLDVNAKNSLFGGFSALHVACNNARTEIVAHLLGVPNVDLNLQNDSGATPFWLCCSSGSISEINLLLKDPRIDVNLPDKNNCTPVWLVAKTGDLKVMRWLVASGRQLNLERRGNWMNISSTPLEIASSGQDQGVAKLLSDLIRHPVETVSEVRRFLGVTRTVIEERLGPLARCAGTSPEVFSRPTEVTYLSLADSGLSTFSQQDSFVNLVELNLSWSQRTLIPESIVNLPLKRLSLCGILGGINLHEILILLPCCLAWI